MLATGHVHFIDLIDNAQGKHHACAWTTDLFKSVIYGKRERVVLLDVKPQQILLRIFVITRSYCDVVFLTIAFHRYCDLFTV